MESAENLSFKERAMYVIDGGMALAVGIIALHLVTNHLEQRAADRRFEEERRLRIEMQTAAEQQSASPEI